MPHEHNEETVFSSCEELLTRQDEITAPLASVSYDSAGITQQASRKDKEPILAYFDRENKQNIPPAPEMRHAEHLNIQDTNMLEAFSTHPGVTGAEQDHDQGTVTDKTIGSHSSVHRAGEPFFTAEQPRPNAHQIKAAEPARPEQCISPTCPVRDIHGIGFYVHNSQWGLWPNETFGISNPPDHIWEAYGRWLANRASPEDIEMIRQFVIHHDRPYTGG